MEQLMTVGKLIETLSKLPLTAEIEAMEFYNKNFCQFSITDEKGEDYNINEHGMVEIWNETESNYNYVKWEDRNN